MQKHQILIVEDDPVNINVLVGTLRDQYNLFIAKTKAKALQLLLEKKIDIVDPIDWSDVATSMSNVVESPRGTAKRIRSDRYRIAGKTGTAQVFTVKQDEEYDEDKIDKKFRDHALFVAYAPVDDPQIAVAVIVENGGHGGSAAAPIARKIMDAYLLGEVNE